MNKTTTIVILTCMIFLAGCSNKPEKVEETPFIGGATGLTMKFVTGAPPDQIFDGGKGEFGVLIELENVGEADVNPGTGYIEIIGINPRNYGLQSQDNLIQGINRRLQKSRKNFEGTVIKGDRTVIEFPQLSYLPNLNGNTPVTFRAELCYDYKTSTSTNVCVKRDVINTGLDTAKICEVSGDKTTFNSGGPVHITSLREDPIGDDKIQLIFEIEHKGGENDQIYKLGSVCDDVITNFDRNKVFVTVTSDIDGRLPECAGLEEPVNPSSGYVTLFDGQKRAVTCTLDLAGVTSIFEELFTVDLQYRYGQFIEKEVTIRDVSTG
jgi:hypothetical protein